MFMKTVWQLILEVKPSAVFSSVKIIPYFVRLFQLFGIGAAGVSVGFLIFEG